MAAPAARKLVSVLVERRRQLKLHEGRRAGKFVSRAPATGFFDGRGNGTGRRGLIVPRASSPHGRRCTTSHGAPSSGLPLHTWRGRRHPRASRRHRRAPPQVAHRRPQGSTSRPSSPIAEPGLRGNPRWEYGTRQCVKADRERNLWQRTCQTFRILHPVKYLSILASATSEASELASSSPGYERA